MLHIAQLAPRVEELAAEALDLLLLLVVTSAWSSPSLTLTAQLLLQVGQLAQELLLLGPVLLLGGAPDLGHPGERPEGDVAPAQVEQRLLPTR